MKRWTRWEETKNVIGPDGVRRLREHETLITNSRFTVTRTEMSDGLTWLSFKNKDRTARHDWRDIQRMKNEICGPEREAVEVYPAESRLHDSANQFHIWVLPEGAGVPFGFADRYVSEFRPEGTGSQRTFEKKPADLLTREEMDAKSQFVKWFQLEAPKEVSDEG